MTAQDLLFVPYVTIGNRGSCCKGIGSAFLSLFLALGMAGGHSTSIASQDTTAYVAISTARGTDTLVQGLHESILISYDSGVDTLGAYFLALQWLFSNGNIVGPLFDTGTTPNVFFSQKAKTAFEYLEWDLPTGLEVTDPDLTGAIGADADFSPPWTNKGVLLELRVSAIDTGSIQIVPRPPVHAWSWFGRPAGDLILTRWISPVFTVVPCTDAALMWGDSNIDGTVTSADIIFLINHVFKSGSPPAIFELGDFDCSGVISAADLIGYVNYVFKSGIAPCNPCQQ